MRGTEKMRLSGSRRTSQDISNYGRISRRFKLVLGTRDCSARLREVAGTALSKARTGLRKRDWKFQCRTALSRHQARNLKMLHESRSNGRLLPRLRMPRLRYLHDRRSRHQQVRRQLYRLAIPLNLPYNQQSASNSQSMPNIHP